MTYRFPKILTRQEKEIRQSCPLSLSGRVSNLLPDLLSIPAIREVILLVINFSISVTGMQTLQTVLNWIHLQVLSGNLTCKVVIFSEQVDKHEPVRLKLPELYLYCLLDQQQEFRGCLFGNSVLDTKLNLVPPRSNSPWRLWYTRPSCCRAGWFPSLINCKHWEK